MTVKSQAGVEDLYAIAEKAELVEGDVVRMSPTGDLPNTVAGEIFASLREWSRTTGSGRAYTDNVAFLVDLPHRQSFSPDVALYQGPRSGMKFLQGAPVFAVEVRSEGDYGARAERQMARKRADYFAAGTLVVWDVDLLGRDTVRVYRATDPTTPTVYRRGEVAEAEPAVPGWRMAVNDLFI